MSENVDLFSASVEEITLSKVNAWQMVTNHANLFYMLATGLIMPPDGFGRKYYNDTLSIYPGYIPLFPEHVSSEAIKYSIAEKPHLIPCIFTIELSCFTGKAKIINRFGQIEDVNFPDGVDSSCKLLLLPAPLPISCLKSILFKSKEDKVYCEKDVQDYSNVDLTHYVRKVSASEFSKLKDQPWPINDVSIPSLKVVLDLPLAAGAIMGLLVNMSHRGNLFIEAGKLSFDQENDCFEISEYPVIAAMSDWFKSGHAQSSGDVSQKLFWALVNKVAETRFSDPQYNSVDVAIDYLQSMPEDAYDYKVRDYGKKLASDLRSIAGFSDSTISEIFERHPKPVSRAMALFALRERMDELLEFSHPLLTQADYVHAAILFSARQSWLGLSNALREFPGLVNAVSHRMAVMSHRISATNFDLGPSPARPRSLSELFASDTSSFSKLQNEAALYMARELKWNCIHTRIALGKGEYTLSVVNGGVELSLPGDIKAVVTEVVPDAFRANLSDGIIPLKLHHKILDIFKASN